MFPKPFTYHRPTDAGETLALLAQFGDDAALYAGGTELLLAMKMGFAQYDHLIDLKRMPELRTIERREDVLSVGALATHAEIASNETVSNTVPALATLCGEIANPRVRSAGTIGGNLCFAEPRADPPTLLAALDAELCLVSPRGERRVPAGGFVTGALETVRAQDELLLRIEIPLPARAIRYERIVFDHRTVAGAAATVASGAAHVWVGCVASYPSPLPKTERFLAADPSASGDGALRKILAQDIATLDIADDEDASADYRRHLAETVVLRAIAGCREAMA